MRRIKISNFFVIVGPSGVGKTVLTDALKAKYPRLAHPISYTTRPPRPDEEDGKDYHFISMDAFTTALLNDEFMAYAEVYGEMYGTKTEDVTNALRKNGKAFVIFNPDGADQVKYLGFPATYIFIAPPDIPTLRSRLSKRGANNTPHRIRMSTLELSYQDKCDYVIINGDFEEALKDLEEIMGLCK